MNYREFQWEMTRLIHETKNNLARHLQNERKRLTGELAELRRDPSISSVSFTRNAEFDQILQQMLSVELFQCNESLENTYSSIDINSEKESGNGSDMDLCLTPPSSPECLLSSFRNSWQVH